MSARVALRWSPWLLPWLLLTAKACTFDDGANPAHGCDDSCPAGACYLGYCLPSLASPSVAGGAGSNGPAGGATSGSAGIGNGGTSTAGAGAAAGAGATPGAGAGGAGGASMMPGCAMSSVAEEICNGLDDDCDSRVDEGTDSACFPDATQGCTAGADGTFSCRGLCAVGVQRCVAGQLGACEGFVGPAKELCGAAEAADEDCDGQVDDDCPCSGDETQRCYSGRAFSAGIGPCRSGTQRCQNGVFGACEGEITPVAESCSNMGVDDDCNLLRDDVPGLGNRCFDWTKRGVCWGGTRLCRSGALVCVTPQPEDDEDSCDGLDEDCDGATDEDFSFGDDPAHCGGCNVRCDAGDRCCNGVCRNPDSDAAHCGECGNACGGDDACCGGACVGTDTTAHCGGCGGCAPGQACCGGGCVDTDSVEHCGGCDGCAPGQACCGGGCVDTDSTDHCGGCGACGFGEACCDGDCVDTSSDQAHCGTCERSCSEACSCQLGECRDAEMGVCP